MKLLVGGGAGTYCGPPTLTLGSVLVLQIKQQFTTKQKGKAKRAAGIEGEVTTMLESHTIQIDTIDTTALNEPEKMHNKQPRGDKTEVPP